MGVIALQDPRLIPTPTLPPELFLLLSTYTKPVHRWLRQIPHFIGRKWRLRGLHLLKVTSWQGWGWVYPRLARSKTEAISTPHTASSSSSAHPGPKGSTPTDQEQGGVSTPGYGNASPAFSESQEK